MNSALVLNLALVDGQQLYVEYQTPLGGVSAFLLPLDAKLGNHEGNFQPGGYGFSLSARNIVLERNILCAELKTSGGDWWYDELEMVVNVSMDPTRANLSAEFRRCDHNRLQGCYNLRLINQRLLAAEYPGPNGKAKDIYVDLKHFVGVKDGAFDRNKRNFSSSVQNAHMIGTTLCATHKDLGHPISIELSRVLRLKNGVFSPLRETTNEDLDYEILTDLSNRRWLPNADIPKLINYRQKRSWYLIANCLNSRGSYQESTIGLHDIIGPGDDEMFAFFSEKSIPEHARETRFGNGILTASFDAGDNKWIQRSFDLAELVINEGGALVKRRFGSECPRCSNLFYSGALYTPSSGSGLRLNGPTVPETRHCTFCKLVNKAIKEYAPVCDWHETWVLTRDRWEDRGSLRVIAKREVLLVIRAYGMKTGTRRILHDWLVRGKQNVPKCVDINCTIMLQVGDNEEVNKKEGARTRAPKRYRTIPRNTHDLCWLDPGLRWSTIRRWIKLCQTEHESCSTPASPQLPSRYLDVGMSDSDPVRLVISNGEHGEYACLSHCWGDSHPCTLTEETKAEYTKKIRKSILPPVFLDAIKVCKKLGLRRLWIDSLCIQQDSKEDWRYESQRMGPYYRNCTICIAATSSANSEKSFEIAERPTVVSSSSTDPESGVFSLLAYPFDLMEEKPHFGHSNDLETALKSFPLLTRAWVLQERWLSPRVLHFCGSEVVFECAQLTTCECGRARESFMDQRKMLADIRRTTTSQEGLIAKRTELAAIGWDHFVTTYSALRITYSTDRLIAISGLASTLYDMRYKFDEGDENGSLPLYLAGLWRTDLTRDMSWFVGSTLISRRVQKSTAEAIGTDRVRKSKSTTYVAPSWSWASISDPIRYFPLDDPDPQFTLLDAQINLATEDIYGPVKEGCYLYLRGKIKTSSWELTSDAQNMSVYRLKDILGTQILGETDQMGVKFSPDYAIAKPGPNQLHSAAMLYIFPLVKIGVSFTVTAGKQEPELIKQTRSTLCLVLKAVNTQSGKARVYERVGFTEYTNFQHGIRNVDPNDYSEEDLYII